MSKKYFNEKIMNIELNNKLVQNMMESITVDRIHDGRKPSNWIYPIIQKVKENNQIYWRLYVFMTPVKDSNGTYRYTYKYVYWIPEEKIRKFLSHETLGGAYNDLIKMSLPRIRELEPTNEKGIPKVHPNRGWSRKDLAKMAKKFNMKENIQLLRG